MIYFYYGENNIESMQKAGELVKSLTIKKPEAGIFKFDSIEFKKNLWEEKIEGQGLFGDSIIIYANKVCENKDCKLFIEKNILDIAKSPNIFIFIENKLSQKLLGDFKKHSEDIEYSRNNEVKTEKDKYNLFKLTNAVGERNNKKAWIELEKAYLAGVPAEEIHPLLFWQIKAILLTKGTSSNQGDYIKNTGLKPYALQKALGFSKNYKETELKKLSSKLTSIFHNALLGGKELEIGLLGFVLTL